MLLLLLPLLQAQQIPVHQIVDETILLHYAL